MNYDVLFVANYRNNKNTEKKEPIPISLSARIPGKMAHAFIEAIFRSGLKFSQADFKVSRIDFKVIAPDFQFTDFDYDLTMFEHFGRIQKFTNPRIEPEQQFAVGYINNRKVDRCVVRTYVSGKRQIKTFELECKRTSAKLYAKYMA